MSWTIPNFEKLQAPPEYQEYIAAIGGLNRFGEANFKIVWGQTETEYIWGTDANGRKGQHIVFKHQGIPSWFIEAWKPPECFGTPELWYAMSWDQETNTHTLGEYPFRGLYMPVSFNLYVKRIIGGGMRYSDPDEHGHCHVIETPARMEIDAMPLCFYILDLIIPNLLKEVDVTFEQKRVALMNRKLAESAAARQKAYDAYMDASPAFGGKAGTYESNREAWMQKLKEKAAGMKLTAQDVEKLLGKGHRQIH
jgi:hypothetical protein